MNIFFFGDSITQGTWDTTGGYVRHFTSVCSNRSINTKFVENYSVFNLGISGDTSVDIKNRIDTEIGNRVNNGDENLIVICIGVNDSMISPNNKNNVDKVEFESNISEIIKISSKYSSNITFIASFPVNNLLLNPIPWDMRFSYSNDEISLYNKITEDVCKISKVNYININDSLIQSKYIEGLKDGIHPDESGHLLIYNNLKSAGLMSFLF